MKNLQVILITCFLIIAVAFSTFFCYDKLMADHEPPVITCDGVPLEVSVHATDRELCAGLTATDDVDGDITERIIVRKISQLYSSNRASIQYAVFDSSSNFCTYSRSISYTDYQKPRFSLSQPLIYNSNSTISLSDRLTATDTFDGDITGRIRLASINVDVSLPGKYPLTVQVTNTSGDTAVATLPVLIENTTSRHPVIRLSQYLIYADTVQSLDESYFRSLIVSARDSADGKAVNASKIDISFDTIDLQKRGSYDVIYSYTNQQGLNYTVVLTVIVE